MQPETLLYPVRVRGDLDPALSRWQWLVKWILAIPHYLVLMAFYYGGMRLVGGGGVRWMGGHHGHWGGGYLSVPLICVLLLIAVVALLFTARYPKGLYDFVIGINRWGIRVRAYTSLMRDEYPPFRLDMGPREPEPSAAPEPRPHPNLPEAVRNYNSPTIRLRVSPGAAPC
ncbi:MAG: DUF4389 domain-containing protein [Mycobacterium sp.]|uniref:DUF4389 domain-containing protein n=1 Tax=Mycobacterium sp. TaxID=1785 RepID=UPI003BB7713C